MRKFGPAHLTGLVLVSIAIGVSATGCNPDKPPKQRPVCSKQAGGVVDCPPAVYRG